MVVACLFRRADIRLGALLRFVVKLEWLKRRFARLDVFLPETMFGGKRIVVTQLLIVCSVM